jgi:beta-galactosidase
VCYFRWRQAPFAQEQLHSGLLRPDSIDAPAMAEAMQVAQDITTAPDIAPVQAPVALIFDYDADWAWGVQPQGQGLTYFSLVFAVYRAMRSLGLSVDIVPPTTKDFTGYKIIAAPGMMHMNDALKQALAASGAHVIYGPRSAARDGDMCIPTTPLPPNLPGFDLRVSRLETLRPGAEIPLEQGGQVTKYFEHVETTAQVIGKTQTGAPVVVHDDRTIYVAGWLDQAGWCNVIGPVCAKAGIDTARLPMGVRVRDTATERFWFNHTRDEHVIGDLALPPISVTRITR